MPKQWSIWMRDQLGAVVLTFTLALLSLSGVPALAQDTPAAQPAEQLQPASVKDEDFAAPVVVDGEELFVVRGFSALPATERAEIIQDRIVAIAELSDANTISVRVLENEFGMAIEANGRSVTVTTEADASYDQLDIAVLAGLQAEAIEVAILSYRENRSNSARVGSAFAAIAWTLAFVAIVYGFFRKRKNLVNFVTRKIERRFAAVEERTKAFVRGKAIAAIVGYFINVLLWVGLLILFYYYLSFVLLAFAETRPVAELLLNYVSLPIAAAAWGIIEYIPSLIVLLIIAAIARVAIQGLRLFFDHLEEGVFEFTQFEAHWIAPTFMLMRVFIIVIAIVFAYPYIPGSDSQAFQGLTILAGIMLSLGSNTVISNMMAGLFVIYRRSTNIGDRIQVGDRIGDVQEIKLMETLIKSTKNEMISIPNAQLLNSEVVNYTRQIDGRGLLVHTSVGIGYEEPPEKVIAMLVEASRRTKSLKKSPPPFVLWTKLADFSIHYEINAYTSRGGTLPQIMSDLHENIVKVFNENDTQIMTPFYTGDPDTPKLSKEVWNEELAVVE